MGRLSATAEVPNGAKGYSMDEIDAKLRQGKPADLYKADLPTPALLIDLEQETVAAACQDS
jgi:hypothetical protein